jgi:FixJ family two-component response regulator
MQDHMAYGYPDRGHIHSTEIAPIEAFASAEDYLNSDRRRDTACLITDVQMLQCMSLLLAHSDRHCAATECPLLG